MNATRFEVIDVNGRILVRLGVKVEVVLQDDGRTMKVFLSEGGMPGFLASASE